MRFHKQSFLLKPDQYPAGSCYPTLYACLLDMELEEVPYFNLFYFESSKEKANFEKYIETNYRQADYADDIKSQNIENFIFDKQRLWDEARRMWLIAMGYTEDYIADVPKFLEENPGKPYIASGISPRDVPHVVAYKDGELFHDPHPSNAGLVKVHYFSYLRDINGEHTFDRYYKRQDA